jgi:hypothetical protein
MLARPANVRAGSDEHYVLVNLLVNKLKCVCCEDFKGLLKYLRLESGVPL